MYFNKIFVIYSFKCLVHTYSLKIWQHDIFFNVRVRVHIGKCTKHKTRHSSYLNSKNDLLRISLKGIKNGMHASLCICGDCEYADDYKL